MTNPKIPGSVISAPSYYNNSNGSLYKVATQRGWNPYLFDLIKRLERGGKKDPLKQEIEKSITVLQLWISELEEPNINKMTTDQILNLIKEEYTIQADKKETADKEGIPSSSMMYAYAMGVLEDLKEKIKDSTNDK